MILIQKLFGWIFVGILKGQGEKQNEFCVEKRQGGRRRKKTV